MMALFLTGCALMLTIVSDVFAFVSHHIPEGYEDEFGFHFGKTPAR
jgi:hypothetical protein